MIHDTQLVRDIAVEHPGATQVFRRYKIDYCCNGARSLSEAAAARGVPLADLRRALDGLQPSAAPAGAAPAELIDHIVTRYHQVHLQEFPEAIRLARRVERVHQDHPLRPQGLADHLAFMADDLEAHQHKEEAVLFPMMLRGPSPMMRFPIERMTAEHADVADQLLHLAVLTTDFTPPQDACTTWRALYAACAKLDADLREHMHLENNVLFPQFL
ncbi:MAG: iron-sulfur cluster repair di-iron protein [Phenylobacterium sp.]|uniref:iron-sulfur cluster repair di-iron protein n=1 Tax=Phenylobacterium sp. TaxID=1871053 RepID=UPI00391ACAAF